MLQTPFLAWVIWLAFGVLQLANMIAKYLNIPNTSDGLRARLVLALLVIQVLLLAGAIGAISIFQIGYSFIFLLLVFMCYILNFLISPAPMTKPDLVLVSVTAAALPVGYMAISLVIPLASLEQTASELQTSEKDVVRALSATDRRLSLIGGRLDSAEDTLIAAKNALKNATDRLDQDHAVIRQRKAK